MGDDHSMECEKCGVWYGGLTGSPCDCTVHINPSGVRAARSTKVRGLSDAEVLAKVQASARIVLHEPADEKGDDAISARVALAMVEQFQWHQVEAENCAMTAAQHLSDARKVFGVAARSTYAERYSCMAGAHSESASRILSALRAAWPHGCSSP